MTTWLAMGIVVIMALAMLIIVSVSLGELLRHLFKGPNRSFWWFGVVVCIGFGLSHTLGWK